MYSTKQNGSLTEIYREDVHIATFDPVEEEVTYTKDEFKRFSKHVSRAVKSLEEPPAEEPPAEEPPAEEPPAEEPPAEEPPAEEPPAEEPPAEEPPAEVSDKDQIKLLKRENGTLKLENARLNDEVKKLRGGQAKSIQSVPDRFSDEFDDSEGRHLMGPHGDLTPEYVEWAHENMPEEIFNKRYHGRL